MKFDVAYLWLALAIGAAVYPRVVFGRPLLRIREPSRRFSWVVAAALLTMLGLTAVAVLAPSAPAGRIGRLAVPLAVFIFMALQFGFVMSSPPSPGSLWLREKGIVFHDGRRNRFIRWQDVDRFEWNGDTLLITPIGTVTGRSVDAFGIEIPANLRGEVETTLASHDISRAK